MSTLRKQATFTHCGSCGRRACKPGFVGVYVDGEGAMYSHVLCRECTARVEEGDHVDVIEAAEPRFGNTGGNA